MRTLCGTILAALLPVAVCAATYKVDIDRSDGLYRCGETTTFTVRVLSTNALAEAANPYAMGVDPAMRPLVTLEPDMGLYIVIK